MNSHRGRKTAAASLLLATMGTVLTGCGDADEPAATSSLTSVPTSTKRPATSGSVSSSAPSTSASSSAVSTASSTAKIKAVTPQSDLEGEPVAQDGSATDGNSTDDSALSADGQASSDSSSEAGALTASGGGVELKADTVTGLSDGQQVTVSLSGLNPQAGYYLAVCGPNRIGPAPMCIGGQGPQSVQHWLSNAVRPGSIPADGNLTTTVSVPKQGRVATGQPLDCSTQQCTIKLFGDPGAGLRDIVELPVSFA